TCDLTRKHRDECTPIGIALVVQAVKHALVQSGNERAEMLSECRCGATFVRCGWECGSPHLGAPVAIQVIEEFRKASNQIGLGEHRVDRNADAEPRLQFLDTAAYGLGVRKAFARGNEG